MIKMILNACKTYNEICSLKHLSLFLRGNPSISFVVILVVPSLLVMIGSHLFVFLFVLWRFVHLDLVNFLFGKLVACCYSNFYLKLG